MAKTHTFTSGYRVGAYLPEFSQNAIKEEPMLFRCDLQNAWHRGGVITRSFLAALPLDWYRSRLSIDSRSHMLMPGWYPCIPGWHHDDVPRERSDGQPNYDNPSYKALHILAIFGDASLTEFATGTITLPDVPLGGRFYRVWHPMVESAAAKGELTRETIPERRLIHFDWETWHQGIPAHKRGWRFFIRATLGNPHPPKNEVRRQSQVYMSDPMAGW